MKKILLSTALFFSFVPAVFAAPEQLSEHGAWTAYTMQDAGANVCFIASKPSDTKGLPATAKRGDTYAMLSHRSDEPTPYVFSYQAGYTYQAGSEVTVKIDDQSYSLYTSEDTAWAKDAETDAKLKDAIRRGSKMSVTGTSARGNTSTDNISLKGTGAALDAIAKACRIGN